jgi:hypothetical protein
MSESNRRPPWTPFGEYNVGVLVRLAEAGNVDARNRLLYFADHVERTGDRMPETLKAWLPTARDQKRRRGRPREHSDDVHAALSLEALKDEAAWAAFAAIKTREAPYERSKKNPRSAFDIIAKWLEDRGHFCSADTVRRWYDERLKSMTAHDEEVQRIVAELASEN